MSGTQNPTANPSGSEIQGDNQTTNDTVGNVTDQNNTVENGTNNPDNNTVVDCSLYLFNECNDMEGCHYVEIYDENGPVSGSCVPDDGGPGTIVECLEGHVGSLGMDPETGMWVGSCSLVQCPEGASGLPCACDADYEGEVSWNNATETWDGGCNVIINEPSPEAWGNGSVRFIYVINDLDPDDVAPFHLRFTAEPMSEQNPVLMTQICSMSEGHKSNVWQAWVSGPFNTVTAWHVENANDLSLGQFKSSSGLNAKNIVGNTHPTASFTREVGVESHIDAVITNKSEYVCAIEPVSDLDGDGMPDSWEESNGLNSSNPSDAALGDADDGLTNLEEYLNGTDPNSNDTDNDGLPDGYEVVWGFNPLNSGDANADPDGDGLTNLQEFSGGTNPYDADTDGDGLSDSLDMFPNDPNETIDFDGDGVGDNADQDDDNDGVDDANDSFPLNASEDSDYDSDGIGDNTDTDDDGDGVDDATDTFPYDASESVDSDGDGLGDNSDVWPNDSRWQHDSDFDGMPDSWELQHFNTLMVGYAADSDGDGLNESTEFRLGTNPLSADSDSDGCEDALDWAPVNSSECFDTDGDGIGNAADPTPWLSSSGNGSFTMNYTIIGVGQVHHLSWVPGNMYAYYYQVTPDHIWTNGSRSPVIELRDMPNVNATLAIFGMSMANLSVSTSQDLGNDTENEDWGWNSTSKIEWRIYDGNLSIFYVDDVALFAINVTLLMYLDYSDLLSSFSPITMWGSSSAGTIIDMTNTGTNVIYLQLLAALRHDLGNASISYNFSSQDAILANTYSWDSNSLPTNATNWLSSVVTADGNVPGGLFDTIISEIHTHNNTTTISSPSSFISNITSGRSVAGSEGATVAMQKEQ